LKLPARAATTGCEWFEDEAQVGAVKARYLVDRILETGLEPFRKPPTLPPIRPEDIGLICWLALLPDGGRDRRPGAPLEAGAV
jgi:hypothetical protein